MIVIALEANQKYYTTSELKNMGYSYYKIGQMEENSQLHRINRTTYENLSYQGDENDFINGDRPEEKSQYSSRLAGNQDILF